jgi:SAM-dependent methyltransferase
MLQDSIELYFSGSKVYGDDFSLDKIAQWYHEEENAYFELVTSSTDGYNYIYHRLNHFHLYRHLGDQRFRRCLAFGCARGDDVSPLARQVERFVAIEPAEKWWCAEILGTPATFIKPLISGDIPFERGTFDLVVCLSVLHHIPNVTHVLSEIGRVSSPEAVFLLREPISTMGDWRKPRPGLTKNQRGFPIQWLERTLRLCGFDTIRRSFCMFPTTHRIGRLLGFRSGYEHLPFLILDAAVSELMSWNLHYHRDSLLKKLAPWDASYILQKR